MFDEENYMNEDMMASIAIEAVVSATGGDSTTSKKIQRLAKMKASGDEAGASALAAEIKSDCEAEREKAKKLKNRKIATIVLGATSAALAAVVAIMGVKMGNQAKAAKIAADAMAKLKDANAKLTKERDASRKIASSYISKQQTEIRAKTAKDNKKVTDWKFLETLETKKDIEKALREGKIDQKTHDTLMSQFDTKGFLKGVRDEAKKKEKAKKAEQEDRKTNQWSAGGYGNSDYDEFGPTDPEAWITESDLAYEDDAIFESMCETIDDLCDFAD